MKTKPKYSHYRSHYGDREWTAAAKRRRVKRERLGLAQLTVADRIGVSGATISRWERCLIRPNEAMERVWEGALYA